MRCTRTDPTIPRQPMSPTFMMFKFIRGQVAGGRGRRSHVEGACLVGRAAPLHLPPIRNPNRSASWIVRAPPVEDAPPPGPPPKAPPVPMIRPKSGPGMNWPVAPISVPIDVSGCEKFGWLNTLWTSARSCTLRLGAMRNCFWSAPSDDHVPKPRRTCAPRPCVTSLREPRALEGRANAAGSPCDAPPPCRP